VATGDGRRGCGSRKGEGEQLSCRARERTRIRRAGGVSRLIY
jgi:hypothetical protein